MGSGEMLHHTRRFLLHDNPRLLASVLLLNINIDSMALQVSKTLNPKP
jgi:hypothetical protein